MASAAQLATRPRIPRLPDGTYAVPDPLTDGVMTLWNVSYGALSPWPLRQRWAPRPPKADPSLPAEERRARRERWYAAVYWPWKVAVADAILRAPLTAASRFDELVPEQERPQAVFAAILGADCPTAEDWARVEEQEAEEQRDRYRRVAVFAAAGLSYRRIARTFRVSTSTAWHWAQRGAALWQAEGPPEALAEALAALPPLDDLKARPADAEAPAEPLSDEDDGFAAWAQRRFGIDPDDLAATPDADDWTDLDLDLGVSVDQITAILGEVDEQGLA
ncbi:helix-turn-helix domain-containing protein [Streptomyces sp. XY533]|uniref:helix-turn-helix domain-containing protein n=1 Tax=Streptomyces sp. XY533 TaxID=1519481 RepID=UPI0006AEE672|nr:helix-turn-helix domain-containing protein [Streptomyces sp. XY533]KOU99093.1 hypothetical protein ADK92_12885 [Streptomyces sp. XY533]